jgi:hypothetical protein
MSGRSYQAGIVLSYVYLGNRQTSRRKISVGTFRELQRVGDVYAESRFGPTTHNVGHQTHPQGDHVGHQTHP